MKSSLPASAALLAALLLTAGGSADRQIAPYRGAAIELDGVIGAEEWSDARRFAMSGGAELFLKRDEGSLYLALRGDGPGRVHVYLGAGSTIRVLHASAALGHVDYVKGESEWRRQSSFRWELEDPGSSEEARLARAAHLVEKGWVASTGRMGDPGDFELIVALRGIDAPAVRLAALFAEGDGKTHLWPANLADGCVSEGLLRGDPPETLRFDPKGWIQVILQLE